MLGVGVVPGIEIPGLWGVGVGCVVVTSPPPLRCGFVLLCLFHGLRDALASLHPWLHACAPSGRKDPLLQACAPSGRRGGSWDGERGWGVEGG